MKCKLVLEEPKMLCCDHFGIKPDILILGKALSGEYFLFLQYFLQMNNAYNKTWRTWINFWGKSISM